MSKVSILNIIIEPYYYEQIPQINSLLNDFLANEIPYNKSETWNVFKHLFDSKSHSLIVLSLDELIMSNAC